MALSLLLNKCRRELYKILSRTGLERARVNYEGINLSVPILNGLGAGHLVARDPWMSQCLAAFLKRKPGLVVDVGVNIGLYLLKLKALDAKREYVGFEPNASCNYYTQELIEANEFDNIRVFPFALSDKQELRDFYTLKKGDKMGSLHTASTAKTSGKVATSLLTMTGDEVLQILEPEAICVIKIDVEGDELEVLSGLRSSISRFRPYIYCEIWDLPAVSAPDYVERKLRAEQVLNLMRDIGYSIYGVQCETRQLRRIESAEAFCSQYLRDYIMMDNSENPEIFD